MAWIRPQLISMNPRPAPRHGVYDPGKRGAEAVFLCPDKGPRLWSPPAVNATRRYDTSSTHRPRRPRRHPRRLCRATAGQSRLPPSRPHRAERGQGRDKRFGQRLGRFRASSFPKDSRLSQALAVSRRYYKTLRLRQRVKAAPPASNAAAAHVPGSGTGALGVAATIML